MVLRERGGPVPYRRGQQQLPARWRPQPLDRRDGALVRHRERADLLDLVAPELDPQRVLLGRREHVEDAAAYREIAALLHQVDAGVGHVGQLPYHVFEVGSAALAQLDGYQISEVLQLRLEHGPDRGDHHAQRVAVGMREPAQYRQAPPDGVRTRREPLMRQRLPGRVDRNLVGGQQAAQRGGEVLGLAAGGGDREHRPAAARPVGRGRGHHERAQRRRRGQVEGFEVAAAGEVAGGGQGRIVEGGIEEADELH